MKTKMACEVSTTGSSIKMELEHTIGFRGAARNPIHMTNDNEYAICVSGEQLLINNLTDPHAQSFFKGFDGDITCCDLSANSLMVAAGQSGSNADVLVWDYPNRKLLYRLDEHVHGVECLAFSDDARFLATVGKQSDGQIFVWDMRNGYIVSTGRSAPNPTTALTWGGRVKDIKRRPTDDYLFATAGKNEVRLWAMKPETGQLLSEQCQMYGFNRNYTCLAFSPDGEILFAGTESGDVIMIQVKNLSYISALKCNNGQVLSVKAFGTSPLCVYVCSAQGDLVKFEQREKGFVEIERANLGSGINGLSISSDELELLTGGLEGDVFRVRTSNLQHVLVSQSHFGSVADVCYLGADNNRFATCGADGRVRIWSMENYNVAAEAKNQGKKATAVQCSEDCIIAGWEDGMIRAFDSETCEPLWKIHDAHRENVTCLAMSSNQKYIVSAGNKGAVRVWEMRTRELVSHIKAHMQCVNSVSLFPDNRHALSCSRDRTFLCLDLNEEKCINDHRQPMGGINDVKLHPNDENMVLTVGQERSVTYWDLRQAGYTKKIPLEAESSCLSISHDGTMFATGGMDSVVRLWDIESGKQIDSGDAHSGQVNAITWSPDDRQVVSVGRDFSSCIWNVYRP